MTARNTILLIDDDQRLVKGLQDFLEAHGYVVYSAFDGAQAYPQASARNPALIILDVDMPVTDGIKALGQLRAHPETQFIPVIMMTGVASAKIYPVIENQPLVSHVKKPVDPDDLLSLNNHLMPKK